MIRSMTGFGRGKYENEGREYLVEIKSINHKYCDIGIRLPRSLNGIEYKIRQEMFILNLEIIHLKILVQT